MPYLRAALNPNKQPVKPKLQSVEVYSESDFKLLLAMRKWMREDDISSREELIRMGLA